MRRVVEIPRVARLARDAHKGDRGRLLIVAGSLRMSGAARLARAGARCAGERAW
jgi:NAD(P)H-hydrate repair Nnr-like enzyme with NAD(P)H-hydrate dehydratase domain